MKSKSVFWILFLLNLFNYIDRQVLYAVFPLLKTDLQLTDLQLGAAASVFMAVYMCYAPFVGYLADRTSRPKLIAWSALIWSGATFLCAQVRGFYSLLTARGLIGVGEGGFTTIAQPFLAEHYPKEKHASILAQFGLALPLGGALGYTLGGLIGQHWGWKAAFMLVSIPGVLLALLARKLPDKARQQTLTPPGRTAYAQLFKNKPFLCVCVAQAMITFLIGGYSAWMPTYLVRYLHLDVAQAGTCFGITVIISGALGTYFGGKLAQWWKKYSQQAYYNVIALAAVGCVGPVVLGLHSTTFWPALLWVGAAVSFLFLPTGAMAAALVDTTPAPIRSMAFAVNIFIIHLLGDALSPTVLGGLSEYWNLKTALLLGPVVLLPALGACWYAKKKTPTNN